MPASGPIDETDLHAYVDGLLDPARSDAVEAYLATDPEAAAKVADWRAQNEGIRALFSGEARPGADDRDLLSRAKARTAPRLRLPPFRQWAAAVALLGAGLVIGQALPPLLRDRPAPLLASADTLPQQAHSAFLVYASDVRHPVEVGADEEDHLAAWLGKRLDHPLAIPDLSRLGYRLVGGRLVPVGGQAGAMLMYEDNGGERITVLIGRNDDNRTTSFRYMSEGPVETFYWIDGAIGYAVTGEVSRETLQAIADACYKQFDS